MLILKAMADVSSRLQPPLFHVPLQPGSAHYHMTLYPKPYMYFSNVDMPPGAESEYLYESHTGDMYEPQTA